MPSLTASAPHMPRPDWRVPYEHMDFVWVSQHYDVHLEGLCRMGGTLCRFETPWPARSRIRCHVFRLTWRARWQWRCRQWLFERCVGQHWSYPQRRRGVRFYSKRPRWLWQALFRAYYRLPRGGVVSQHAQRRRAH